MLYSNRVCELSISSSGEELEGGLSYLKSAQENLFGNCIYIKQRVIGSGSRNGRVQRFYG